MTDFTPSMKMTSTSMWQLNSNLTKQKLSTAKADKETGQDPKEIKAVCQEFESLFLNYMLKEMRSTVPKSDLLDGGQAERIYTSMFDERLSQELAQKGGIGLAQMLEKNLLANQNNKTNE